MMLPGVVRFNAQDPAAQAAYAELASAPEIACVSDGIENAVQALIARLEWLINSAGIPRSLVDCGVNQAAVQSLAQEAAQQWTARFNPRLISPNDFAGLYTAALDPRGPGTPP